MLNEMLRDLQESGCFPVISYRVGGVWRAHVNGAGNFWADSNSPISAMSEAIKTWDDNGRPMDGYAII